MDNWISVKTTLPNPSIENKRRSIKVINQDGDSVYYSYGYKCWHWYLSVDLEEEGTHPKVTHWQPKPAPPKEKDSD